MAGFVHHRDSAGRNNRGRQALRALNVKHDATAWHPAQHVAREQHHLAVGVDVGAILGDDAQPVTVAVKGQAQFGITGLQCGDQVVQILRLARVGVVVGEIAVHFAEQLGYLAANRAQNGRGRCARHAIAAIDNNLDRPRQLDVADDARLIRLHHIGRLAQATRFERPAFGLHGLAQVLDVVAINGATRQHHFEAVVVFGVVAASHLDAATAQRVGCEVQHGRGDHADIDDGDARVLQPGHQCLGQSGATQPAIAPHGNRGLPFGQRHRAKRTTQAARDVFVDSRRHYAADVVGFEDAG